jgi:hypothetical protein
MKPHLYSKISLTLLLLLSHFLLPSQIALYNVDRLDQLKKGTTYFVIKEPDFKIPEEYIDIVKKYWTYSKIAFIKKEEIAGHLQPENSFFMIGGYSKHVTMTTISYDLTYIYFDLWMGSEKYFKNNKGKAFDVSDQQTIARIELFTDFPTLEKPDMIYKDDYDEYEHIRNWGPGYLKNYLQQLMYLMEKKEARTLDTYHIDRVKIKELKQQTLYIPEYILIKFNKWNGKEDQRHDEKELFKDYEFNYQLISNDELNQKILQSETPIYYLIYVKSSTDQYISVVNSKDGSLLYTVYDRISYNIKDKDIGDLSKAIERKYLKE